MTRLSFRFLVLAILCMIACFASSQALAQGDNYTKQQITFDAVDHKWPAVNTSGTKVWCQQVGGYWHVFRDGAQITSGSNDHRYPVISDAGDIVYVKYGIGQGVGRHIIKHPNTLIEFSSVNTISRSRRNAGQHHGISSNGTIIWYYDWLPFGIFEGRRLFVSGMGQILNDFSPFDYPDINADGVIVFSSGSVYKATAQSPGSATFVANGINPRVADGVDPEIVYVSGSKVVSTKGGEVDDGAWADVNNEGAIVYEKQVNGVSQIFLATPSTLPAPTILRVTTVSSTKLKVEWDYPGGDIDGFQIERTTDSGGLVLVTKGPSDRDLTDTGLTTDTKYTYRIRAFKGQTNPIYSEYSDPASGTPKLLAPSNLTATAVSPRKIQLAWQDKSDEEDGFIIERKNGNGPFIEIKRVDANVETVADRGHTFPDLVVNDPGPTHDTTYTYQVKAFKGDTNPIYSKYSDPPASATTLAADPSDKPTITAPPDLPAILGNWRMSVAVSEEEGVVVRDVVLHNNSGGARYMAKQISLPYFFLSTKTRNQSNEEVARFAGRSNLKPDSGDENARCRLIKIERTFGNINFFGKTIPGGVIHAEYVVDRIPKDSESCLHITQRYEFFQTTPGDAGEPKMTVLIARFRPMVRYNFYGYEGETLGLFNAAQRLHFQTDGLPFNFAGAFQDNTFPAPPINPVTDPLFGENPLRRESSALAVYKGKAWNTYFNTFAGADNFHQTWRDHVEEPGFNFEVGPHAGCLECVHMHWRWSTAAAAIGGFEPQFGQLGEPLIRQGSDQDLWFAVVRSDRMIEPEDFSLSGPRDPRQSLLGANIAFWYSATGYQNQDTFFMHGGFFASPAENITSQVLVEPRGLLRLRSGRWAQEVRITNRSNSTIQGPIALVLDNLQQNNVELRNSSGITLGTTPRLSPYVEINLAPSGVLRPNETATILLIYDDRRPNDWLPARVLGGPGIK